MYTAQQTRKENIAEYILYLWQLEDLLRALQFSPEAIYAKLVAPRQLSEEQKQALFLWYMELINLLREEGKEQNGHLEHTLHLIADLNNLHLQLLSLPIGKYYRELFGKVAPEIPALKARLKKSDISDIELFFRALYAVVLLRIKGEEKSKEHYIHDVLELISPVIAELAKIFRQTERGEIDLFATEEQLAAAEAAVAAKRNAEHPTHTDSQS